MVIVELRPGGAKRFTLHHRVTVISRMPADEQEALVALIDRVARGDSGEGEVIVEVDGNRHTLSGGGTAPDGIRRPVVFDLGHIRVDDADSRTDDANAAITLAESAVADSRAALDAAEAAHRDALTALTEARDSIPPDASTDLGAAEARLREVEAAVAVARRALADAEESGARASDDAARRVSELSARRDELEARRETIVARLRESGDAVDPEPVQSALSSLNRLLDVKPKPSLSAITLADEWAEVCRQLDALPSPPPPPEWLAAPALAALNEAREALARAEAGAPAIEVDREAVAALEQAHRDLVEAEQKVTDRPSRGNRKRLAQAAAAEEEALRRVGVASFGDYLRDIAPAFEQSSRDERIERARAALADAETVWNELHGGDLPEGWTELKRRQEEIRERAAEQLGEPVSDDELEQRLRSHVETVVDASWAEQALAEALADAGVDLGPDGPGGDLHAAAEAWLPGARERFAKRQQIEGELSDVERELTEVQSQVTEHQSDAFFAPDGAGEPGVTNAESLHEALRAAEAAHRDALESVEEMRRSVEAVREKESRVAHLEEQAADQDRARGEAQARLEEAEAALRSARDAAATATADVARARTAVGNGVANVEAEMQLVVLAAVARAAGGAPLVMVGAVPAAPLGPRLLSLAARAAEGGLQVIVAGGDEQSEAWAKTRKDVRVVRP